MKKKISYLLLRSILFVIICASFAFVFNCISTDGIPLINPSRKLTVEGQTIKIPVFMTARIISAQKDHPLLFHPTAEMTIDSVYYHFRSGDAVFIDARSTEEYQQGHIARAISVPLEEFDPSMPLLKQLAFHQKTITYCSGDQCEQSIDLAVRLEELGFGDVYFYTGGFQEWKDAGYPTWKGEMP